MEPYYQDDWATIYHGDCLELLPQMPKVDLVLTDPPWPMSTSKHRKTAGRGLMAGNENAVELWSKTATLLRCKRLLVWLSIHSDPRDFLNVIRLPYLRATYIRRAIPGYFGRVLMDGELIHALGEWPIARKGAMVIPGGLSITYIANDRHNGHPGPRSLIATKWLLKWWASEGETIRDPFVGSGTTLLAAKELNLKAEGIEIEEKYCEIAANRLRQEVLDFRPAEAKP